MPRKSTKFKVNSSSLLSWYGTSKRKLPKKIIRLAALMLTELVVWRLWTCVGIAKLKCNTHWRDSRNFNPLDVFHRCCRRTKVSLQTQKHVPKAELVKSNFIITWMVMFIGAESACELLKTKSPLNMNGFLKASKAHASVLERDPKIKSWDSHFVRYLSVGLLPSWNDNILLYGTTGHYLSHSAMRMIKKNAKNLGERGGHEISWHSET